MKKVNIFKRIVSSMLIATLVVSANPFGLSSKDKVVEASGDGTGYSVGGSPSGGASARLSTSDGSWSGLRFTLVPVSLLCDSDKKFKGFFNESNPNVTSYTAEDMYKYISSREQYSIVVTKFSGDLYCMPKRGAGYINASGDEKLWSKQIKVSNLKDLFGDVNVDGNFKSFPQSGKNDYGTDVSFDPRLWKGDTFDVGKNNGYFGEKGIFSKVVAEEGNKNLMVNHFKKVLKTFGGRNLDSSVNADNCIIVVEPVVISYVDDGSGLRKGNGVQGKHFALSLQDCLYKDQKGTKWSYAFTQAAYPCQNESPSKYIKQGGMWRTLLLNMKSYFFRFRDTENTFGKGKKAFMKSGVGLSENKSYWDTGFALYGTDVSASLGAKTAVSYTLFCDNSADKPTSQVNEVWARSLGTIPSSNYNSIYINMEEDGDENVTLLDTLDSNADTLRELTYSTSYTGGFKHNSDGDTAGKSLSSNLTGRDEGQWKSRLGVYADDYVNTGFGIYKIPYDSAVKTSVKKLYQATTGEEILNDIKNFTLESKRVSVSSGDFDKCTVELGNMYSLRIAGTANDNYNIAKAVAGTVKASSPIFYKTEDLFKTNVGFQRLGSLSTAKKYNNVAINGALYALKSSKPLESLAMDSDGKNGDIEAKESEGSTYKDFVDENNDGVIDLDENGNEIYKKVTEPADRSKLSSLGVSVMLMAPKNEVTSYLACATLNRDTGEVYRKQQDEVSYDVSESGVLKIPSAYRTRCFYVAFPNTCEYNLESDNKGNKVFDAFNGNTEITSLDEFLECVKSATGLTDSDFVAKGSKLRAGSTIRLGCTDRDLGDITGYSVILLELKGNITKEATLELMDYELNYVHPSMITDGNYASLISDISHKTLYMTSVGCISRPSAVYEASDDKFAKASVNYSGNIINKNLDLGENKNILQYDEYTEGIFTTELNARNKYTFTDNFTNVKFSLAVNLIRSSFGDRRVVSSITAQTKEEGVADGISKKYAIENLELTFGNTPNSEVLASESRNSNATVGTVLKDIFEWDVDFDKTDNSPYLSDLISGYTGCYGHTVGGITIYGCSPSVWYQVVGTDVTASDFGYRVKYDVSEKAYKYQTEELDPSGNTIRAVDGSLQIPQSGLNNNNSVLTNPYKIALVNTSDDTLMFYPEVMMRAYSTVGDSISGAYNGSESSNRSASNYVSPHNILTMGEVKRKVKPSSLYTIRVTAPNNNVITGKIKSDSTAVGSNASDISGGKPVIYAGGDISLNVSPKFELNMYGYSLDLIEPTDNELIGTGNYYSVIADGSPVKEIWGNDTSYDPLDDFKTWVSDTLGNLAADTTLTVKGNGVNKTYNNFSCSIANLRAGNPEQDGVYSIKIAEGNIVKESGYKELIAQIKKDYNLSTTGEAEQLFKKSDIYQSITRAIEDCKDSFNKSQKSSAIGSRAHWYDEQVKTFVVRRLKVENVQIKNIVVNDKLDYNAAPTAGGTSNSNSSYKGADAKWYLTLYFKQLPSGFEDGTTLYESSNHNKLSSANTAGTVLINEVYVNNADFVVPSSSTHDMGN